MRLLDWAIVAAYLIYVIWDGIRMTKHSGSKEGYFLANRSLPWWAVGLSVMATQLSAITLVGTPAGLFGRDAVHSVLLRLAVRNDYIVRDGRAVLSQGPGFHCI